MTPRDYRDYLSDIVEAIQDIGTFTAGMRSDEFASDKKTVNAVIRSIEIVGEASKKIPDSLRDAYPTIPWKRKGASTSNLNFSGIKGSVVSDRLLSPQGH